MWYVLRFTIFLNLTLFSHYGQTVSATTISAPNQIIEAFNQGQATLGRVRKLMQDDLFQTLNVKGKEEVLNHFANALTVQYQIADTNLKLVFTSKVYKFVLNYLKKEIQLPHQDLSDVTVVFDPKTQKFIALFLSIGPSTIQGRISETMQFGFYFSKILEIPLNQAAIKGKVRISWIHSGQSYDAVIDFKPKTKESILVTTKSAPDYENLLADKVFKTVIVLSQNLIEDKDFLMQSYFRYYVQSGLEFFDLKRISDTKEFLAQNFYGDEPMDIFIKEAHSSGDEKNVMPVAKESTVYRAVKQHAQYQEVIELVVPEVKSRSELFTIPEFAKYMALREEKLKTELIYLNTSCWSDQKAVNEINSVHSPYLINIPAKSVTTILNAYDKSGTYLLVDGFRHFKDFNSIKDSIYAYLRINKKANDQYLFPNDSEYNQRILERIPPGIDVIVDMSRLNDGRSVPYSIEAEY